MVRWAKEGLELLRRHPAVLLTAALPLVLVELGMIALSGGVLPLPVPTLRVVTGSGSVLGLVLALLLALGVAPLLRVGLQLVAYGLRRGRPVSPALVLLPFVRRPGSVLLTVWVVWIGTLLASLLLIVPGVLRALSWTFAPLLALVLVNTPDNGREVSADLTHGHRGKLFLLLLSLSAVEMVGDVVAFGLGEGRPGVGFVLWIAVQVFTTGWWAGAVAAAFDQALAGFVLEGDLRSELERALAFSRWSVRPAWAVPPLIGALAALVLITPKDFWNPTDLIQVNVLPSSPPPPGALVTLGTGELNDVVLLPDGERILLLTQRGIEVRRLPDLEPIQFIAGAGGWSCAVSRAGDLAATWGSVVDLSEGKLIATYPWGRAEAFDRTGEELLTAWCRCTDGHVTVHVQSYNPRTGEELWKMDSKLDLDCGRDTDVKVAFVELSPQGGTVLIVLRTWFWPMTYVLDRVTGDTVVFLRGIGAFAADGTVVAADEGRLRVVHPGDGQPLRELLHSSKTGARFRFTGNFRLSRTAVSEDGRRAATVVTETMEAVVWDLVQGKVLLTVPLILRQRKVDVPRLKVGSLCIPIPWALKKDDLASFTLPWTLHLAPNGRWLALAFRNQLIVIDVETGKKRDWCTSSTALTPLWLPDGKTLVTEGMSLWDASSGAPIGLLWPGEGFPWAVSSAGKTLLSSRGDDLSLWSIGSWRRLATFSLSGHVRFASFGPGAEMATVVLEYGSYPSRVQKLAWVSLRDGSETRGLTLQEHERVLALSPRGRYALISLGSQLAVVELGAGNRLAEWHGPPGVTPAYGVFSPDERFLSVGYRYPGGVEVLVLETGERRWMADLLVEGLAFDPQVRVLAALPRDEGLVAWDLQSGEEVHRLPGAAPSRQYYYDEVRPPLAFAPDGSRLAVVDGAVTLWPWPPFRAVP